MDYYLSLSFTVESGPLENLLDLKDFLIDFIKVRSWLSEELYDYLSISLFLDLKFFESSYIFYYVY
jgi:hypothetical protein